MMTNPAKQDAKLQKEKTVGEIQQTKTLLPSEIRRLCRVYLDLSHCALFGVLAPLSPHIEVLDISANRLENIDAIQDLPNLRVLRVNNNLLRRLPSPLPPRLQQLECNNNLLETLPSPLPPGLKILKCASNTIRELPPLPDTLEELAANRNLLWEPPRYDPQMSQLKHIQCNFNQIVAWFRHFPPGLQTFECCKNALIMMETLPDSLTCLRVFSNVLRQLPNLPPRLEILDCAENNLETLPPLPDTLKTANLYGNLLREIKYDPLNSALEEADCRSNKIVHWTLPLPPQLSELSLSFNARLTTLPPNLASCTALRKLRISATALRPENVRLPPNLRLLACAGSTAKNKFRCLPDLPADLKWLAASNNALERLPNIPPNLVYLDCSINPLAELPPLPEVLETLNCSNCQLTELPALPVGLKTVECSGNMLRTIPEYPPELVRLVCFDNPELTGLPHNPEGRVTIQADFRFVFRHPTAIAGDFEFRFRRTPEAAGAATPIQCPVCFETTQDWVCSEVCRHKLCSSCFISLVESQVKRESEDVVCPCCRGDMSCMEFSMDAAEAAAAAAAHPEPNISPA